MTGMNSARSGNTCTRERAREWNSNDKSMKLDDEARAAIGGTLPRLLLSRSLAASFLPAIVPVLHSATLGTERRPVTRSWREWLIPASSVNAVDLLLVFEEYRLRNLRFEKEAVVFAK